MRAKCVLALTTTTKEIECVILGALSIPASRVIKSTRLVIFTLNSLMHFTHACAFYAIELVVDTCFIQ